MLRIIVTEKPKEWLIELPGVELMTPAEYISLDPELTERSVKVINMCKSYQYQSEGYYISLLAEARGHKVLPVTSTMMDYKLPNLAREDAQDFNTIIQESLEKSGADAVCEFNIYFGKTENPALAKIALLLFNLFQVPMQKVSFVKKDKWQLGALKPINIKELAPAERETLTEALHYFLSSKQVVRKNYRRKKYDLGILVNPEEKTPPSDPRAIQKFVKAAEKSGFNVELITKADYGRLTQFDALFIRETTSVNHHTFRFARKADYECIAVIDDPNSILKCTNKVYLQELLEANDIPTPKSAILQKNEKGAVLPDFDFPFVLKKPDSAFSQGVKKVSNKEELDSWLKQFFEETEIVIAQEFMPTDFDWRIGVLGGKIIYVCKYFMARNHWQIVDWKTGGASRVGKSESMPISEAPKKLCAMALKATKLIGNGLYGVDIKESNGKFYVIEINDNPSIDHGVEDQVEKQKLYQNITDHLMQLVNEI